MKHVCPKCSKWFRSKGGLAVHRCRPTPGWRQGLQPLKWGSVTVLMAALLPGPGPGYKYIRIYVHVPSLNVFIPNFPAVSIYTSTTYVHMLPCPPFSLPPSLHFILTFLSLTNCTYVLVLVHLQFHKIVIITRGKDFSLNTYTSTCTNMYVYYRSWTVE